MKLRYCCNLTTTPDFSKITNLEELSLEGCVNLISVHPSIGMLKKLVVLNLRDCKRLQSFPCRVEMDALQVLNLTGCLKVDQLPQALEVSKSIGGLSCLVELHLEGNNYTILPRSLSQLSSLKWLNVDGCKKLEVLPELPHSTCRWGMLDKDTFPSDNPQQKVRFLSDLSGGGGVLELDVARAGNTLPTPGMCPRCLPLLAKRLISSSVNTPQTLIPLRPNLGVLQYILEWFTNRSTENPLKVELPSDWSYDKFRGYGTCVVFKCKKPLKFKGYSVKNFDGASLNPQDYFPVLVENYFQMEVIGIQESYMIWLNYTWHSWEWKKAKNFVSFCFQENNENVKVKEFGARLVCDEDIQQERDLSMLQSLPTPTQHGGFLKRKTRQKLAQKIAELNSAIDDVSTQLKSDDDEPANGVVLDKTDALA
ncbi:NB-ARC domains-containing protein [Tanacetum coccineum]